MQSNKQTPSVISKLVIVSSLLLSTNHITAQTKPNKPEHEPYGFTNYVWPKIKAAGTSSLVFATNKTRNLLGMFQDYLLDYPDRTHKFFNNGYKIIGKFKHHVALQKSIPQELLTDYLSWELFLLYLNNLTTGSVKQQFPADTIKETLKAAFDELDRLIKQNRTVQTNSIKMWYKRELTVQRLPKEPRKIADLVINIRDTVTENLYHLLDELLTLELSS